MEWAPPGEIRIKGRNEGGSYGADEDPEFEVELESAVVSGLSLTTTETIKAYLKDSSENPTGIEPEINRIGNKYQIKIPKKRSIHPGLYKLVVESGSHEEEIWFTWGLITVNTNKSIYRPNETAQIFIVVLDKNGYPVSGADVSLRVAGPDGSTVYSTLDGGIRQIKRGIYEALYRPAREGNYDLHAEVRGYELNSSIESTFQVRNFYEFDILRIDPLMIDPWKGPFSSRIRLISHINYLNFTFRESIPSDLEIVSTDADSVSHNDGEYILTWSNLENNSEVSYTLRPPLKSPHLYKLGPAEIEYGKELFREPRYWLMASDPSTEINVSAAQGTGAGVLPDTLQADDGSFYEVDKGENVHVTGFNVTGFTGTITSVTLYVRYSVESGFGGDNYLNYSLNNGTSWNETTIQPLFTDTSEVERSYEITDPLTWDDLRYLDVRYDNNDFAQPDWVRFDRIWLLVEYNPPPPAATTWNLSVSDGTIVPRGDTVKAYALWDTKISLAYIEHNGSGSFINYTISGPYSENWTNHSINTSNATQFPLAGPVYVKIWARDNYNQWNDTSPLRYFILWGLASVVNSSLNPDTLEQGNSTTMRCRVVDSNTSQPIGGYNVSFYNGTSSMGVNQTNATGWASWTFTDNTLGLENITCNITDHVPLYYNASSENEKVEVLDTQPPGSDVISPTITDISATPQNVGVGNTVTINANVTDNVAVDTVYVNISYGGSMYQYP
ncbi:MAG: hypothetical protein KAU03_00605, partial [Candidatus Altiarchaeales archaeon]|nr:hypothetical protein [Candidatus Altiarchaeales archaeon]